MGYYLYKGLKKPLVFFGLKGKYIFYAVGVIGGGVIAALVLSKFGLLGSLFEENTSRLCLGVNEEKFEKRMVFHNTMKKCKFD